MKEKTRKLVEAFGFLKIDEAQLLMDTADGLGQGAIVVNVGAGAGTSALAVIEQRPDLAKTFYTVDMRDDDNPFGGMLNERHAFQNAKMEDMLPNQIKGDSSSIGKTWGKGPIDFLIIDADHTAEGLTKDIEAWLPHLVTGGYVAFHDYASDKWPEVYAVVNELVSNDHEYEQVDVKSTMILFRKLKKKKVVAEPKKETEAAHDNVYTKDDVRMDSKPLVKQNSANSKRTSSRKKIDKKTNEE
jgi:predicted O-methyltransferase YrrM